MLWRVVIPVAKALPHCATGWHPQKISEGDTCWDIENREGTDTESLIGQNPGLGCDHLIPGDHICVPMHLQASE